MSVLADLSLCNAEPKPVSPAPRPVVSGDSLHFSRCAAVLQIYKQIEKVATVDVPVLFLGESGVGKEFFAKHLHQLSPRARRPFLKVNCAALPSELLESELFGFEAGAFTGATRPKPGQFELCDEGTILLDEIAEMPTSMQAKLLHILQDQRFSRLGGRKMIQGNVRVLAATNVNIDEALAQKRFRVDLYYRLNTIIFSIPPLRERREDITPLLDHFLAEAALQFGFVPRPISRSLKEACLQYPWPGNIRELQGFACRFLLQEDDDALLAELRGSSTPEIVEEDSSEEPCTADLGLKSLGRKIRAHAEKQMIQDALVKTYWNRAEAARMLKISYKSLRNKIRLYEISTAPRSSPSSVDTSAMPSPRGRTALSHPSRTATEPARADISEDSGALSRQSLAGRYAAIRG